MYCKFQLSIISSGNKLEVYPFYKEYVMMTVFKDNYNTAKITFFHHFTLSLTNKFHVYFYDNCGKYRPILITLSRYSQR